MKRTALLIGSNHGGLRGVHNDLAAMEKALTARGFVPRMCGPSEATRAGILAEYEKLIADAEPDDAIVVYYTGHGGFAVPADRPDNGPAEVQYIVPVDFSESNMEDFRGIAAAELSILQNRLTTITRNVTVILDCCHSSRMSRGDSATVKSMSPSPYALVQAHLDRLSARGLRADTVRVEGNQRAVRIVACAPEQRAYEYPGAGDVWAGVLTESLVLALAASGREPVTWATVVDWIRNRVIRLGFEQRPEVEGPSDRLLFDIEEAELIHSLPVTSLGAGQARLDCAPLLEVQHGDEFMVMPAGRPRADEAQRIGHLKIGAVSSMSATGTVSFAPPHATVPLGARAFRTKMTAPRIPIRIPVDDPRSERVREAFQLAALARVAEPGDDPVDEVRISADGSLELCDRDGSLHPPYDGHDRVHKLASAVKTFAQATRLRQLANDHSYPLSAGVAIEWGLVVDGEPRRLATKDEVLLPGQHIYVTVRNNSQIPVYVSLLDIGISGRITLIYNTTPAGRRLPAGDSLTLGMNEFTHELTGVELSWPDDLTPARARRETLLVVLTSKPQDLSPLQQHGIDQRRGDRGFSGSPLQNMIDQLATGGTRDIGAEQSNDVRYSIYSIDFEMEQPS